MHRHFRSFFRSFFFRSSFFPSLWAGITGSCLITVTHSAEPRRSDPLREEIVVTASRQPQSPLQVGSSVTRIGQESLDARQSPFVPDLLREVPGVAVNRSGPVGGLTQIRMRGAEGNHTLVLIDGIEANDPAFGSEFNFAPLLTRGIGRIEVLRGPQSALWGSDAIGGVISLHSALPADGEQPLMIDATAGSQATTHTSVQAGYGRDRFRGAISATRYRTAGSSASALQPERDGIDTRTFHGIAEADVADGLTTRLVLRQTDSLVEEDVQDFAFPSTPTQGLVIDSRNATDFHQRYGLAELRHAGFDDRLRQHLAFGWTDTHSHFIDAGRTTSATAGNRRTFAYDASATFGDRVTHTITLGAQHEALRFRNRAVDFSGVDQNRDDRQTGGILEYNLGIAETLWLGAAVRHDWNHRFKDATTYRATASWLVNRHGTRLHASYGEGIANPGFFELFGFIPASFAGNPDLKPEYSRGYDFGIEQSLLDGRILIDLTGFSSNFTDEINTVFDFTTFLSSPVNLDGESRRKGVELSISADPHPSVSLQATYAFVDAEDREQQQEIRRPRHTASANLQYRFAGGRGSVNLGAAYNGRQRDAEFIFATPQDRVTLDDWLLVNLAASFDVTTNIRVHARVDNLFDEDYQELFGFRSPGTTGLIGVSVSLR